ncbi:hypothetical protein CEXT_678212 [Caerostris extrusa]|uniref:Secreted protein n=1 Tax=Caerostris extrusa TaxID=172846 RepID=A0AAV4TC23_CAEEX|nr:hypothetical protein CEXT_678212 [Caerostris extrusa]
MRASKLFFLFCFLFVLTRTQAQFFTKTTNSIPRLEGQINPFLPNLVRHVAKQLHFNAMKSELEAIELRELPMEKQRENQNQVGNKG